LRLTRTHTNTLWACTPQDEVLSDVAGLNWGGFKPLLTDALVAHLSPIQARCAACDGAGFVRACMCASHVRLCCCFGIWQAVGAMGALVVVRALSHQQGACADTHINTHQDTATRTHTPLLSPLPVGMMR
jgi:hypothetical protein